ncbi:galanin receptor type 1 [Exaiptasia diaphana]|uniref:G-protein coupled receptors family 1 profile domain-containing protein n=1 Tax=Exaiptasia diaphana TaxID=2652724 RepID=A0A913Y8C7_EXADI|nr:galanin receptor type 1 [Exaiptasia diaphana]XP_020915766.1 galanin receptor type 1 [Exaiptasia diaphana]XP_020915773.1 galanin receptor type 1 [Exaiptasia diaphana]KXJ19653.1 Neuropeptide FF receptor 2 [Exaiptasia diaphana]
MENSTVSNYERVPSLGVVDYVLISAYVFVITIGFGGNTLVLLVVKRKRSMHTTTNYLLANLSAADLLTLLWCIPGLVTSYTLHPQGNLGDFLCKFVTMHHVAGITLLVSGITLTVLAVERYKALFYPLAVRLTLTRKNVKYPIVCIWLLSIAYVVPLFVGERFNQKVKFCEIVWPGENQALASIIYWGILAFITSVSFIIILFCYFNIIKGIYFTKTICSRGSTHSRDSEGSEKRKIVKLLLTVTLVFLVCFIPFCVMSVLLLDARYALSYKLCYFLVYCSSSLNPFIYAFHSSNYREAFRDILVKMTETLHCDFPKRWSNRCSNKMSDLELRATYHPSNEMAQIPPALDPQNQAKLLSFKRLEKQ